jgi:rieske iron-sulfur protein
MTNCPDGLPLPDRPSPFLSSYTIAPGAALPGDICIVHGAPHKFEHVGADRRNPHDSGRCRHRVMAKGLQRRCVSFNRTGLGVRINERASKVACRFFWRSRSFLAEPQRSARTMPESSLDGTTQVDRVVAELETPCPAPLRRERASHLFAVAHHCRADLPPQQWTYPPGHAGEVIKPGDLKLGEPPVHAWPKDPKTSVIRKGSRLNEILAIKLDPGEMDDETRSRSADGIVAYSAICTHAGCPVTGWLKAETGDRNVLKCFCHNSEFNPMESAQVAFGPAPRRLAALPLVIADGSFTVAATFVGKVGAPQPG